MALTQDIWNQAAEARAKIASADLDEKQREQLYKIISLTTTATNGISPEEKIQKLTEAMHAMTISQVEFITHINKFLSKTLTESLAEHSEKISNMIAITNQTIQSSIANATLSHCKTCKAMNHAEEVEKEEARNKIIEELGGGQKGTPVDTKGNKIDWIVFWQKTISQMITQPWMWIVMAVASLSPYGVNLLNAIRDLFR